MTALNYLPHMRLLSLGERKKEFPGSALRLVARFWFRMKRMHRQQISTPIETRR